MLAGGNLRAKNAASTHLLQVIEIAIELSARVTIQLNHHGCPVDIQGCSEVEIVNRGRDVTDSNGRAGGVRTLRKPTREKPGFNAPRSCIGAPGVSLLNTNAVWTRDLKGAHLRGTCDGPVRERRLPLGGSKLRRVGKR